MAHVACLFSGIIPRDLPRLGPGLWLSSPSREETGFAFTCRTILVQSLHMLTPSSFCTVTQHSQTTLRPTCWGISGQKLPIASHPWVRHDPLRPFSRGSMLFYPFQSAQCHLLASCLFPLCCRIAQLHREAGDTAAVSTTARAVCQGKSRSWSIHTAPALAPQTCGLLEEVLK